MAKAERATRRGRGHSWAFASSSSLSLFPALLHFFLVSTLIIVIIFWICLGCWIVLRLIQTAGDEQSESRHHNAKGDDRDEGSTTVHRRAMKNKQRQPITKKYMKGRNTQ